MGGDFSQGSFCEGLEETLCNGQAEGERPQEQQVGDGLQHHLLHLLPTTHPWGSKALSTDMSSSSTLDLVCIATTRGWVSFILGRSSSLTAGSAQSGQHCHRVSYFLCGGIYLLILTVFSFLRLWRYSCPASRPACNHLPSGMSSSWTGICQGTLFWWCAGPAGLASTAIG